jgi:CubicO group peptidase (beta-lactamase class C family)
VGDRENLVQDHELGAPFKTDSVVWIASLTKLVTTVACLVAVEQGIITLDENVRDIVGELKDLELLVGFEESDGGHPAKPILDKVTNPISLRSATKLSYSQTC